jgi:hypothetical protein
MILTTRPESRTKHRRLEMLEQVLSQPMSYEEAREATGLAKSTIRTYIDELHDQGRIHIADWRCDKYASVMLFQVGRKPDAPRPVRAGSIDDDESDIFKRPKTVVNVHRDPLIAALFGEHRSAT